MPDGKRNERVGTRAGKRAHQKHHDPRNHPARRKNREEIAAAQAQLDARIAREAAELAVILENQRAASELAARGRTEEAQQLMREKVLRQQAAAERKRQQWDLGFARNLVREGYTVQHAVQFTGWPARMLDDVKPGEW